MRTSRPAFVARFGPPRPPLGLVRHPPPVQPQVRVVADRDVCEQHEREQRDRLVGLLQQEQADEQHHHRGRHRPVERAPPRRRAIERSTRSPSRAFVAALAASSRRPSACGRCARAPPPPPRRSRGAWSGVCAWSGPRSLGSTRRCAPPPLRATPRTPVRSRSRARRDRKPRHRHVLREALQRRARGKANQLRARDLRVPAHRLDHPRSGGSSGRSTFIETCATGPGDPAHGAAGHSIVRPTAPALDAPPRRSATPIARTPGRPSRPPSRIRLAMRARPPRRGRGQLEVERDQRLARRDERRARGRVQARRAEVGAQLARTHPRQPPPAPAAQLRARAPARQLAVQEHRYAQRRPISSATTSASAHAAPRCAARGTRAAPRRPRPRRVLADGRRTRASPTSIRSIATRAPASSAAASSPGRRRA